MNFLFATQQHHHHVLQLNLLVEMVNVFQEDKLVMVTSTVLTVQMKIQDFAVSINN